MCLRIIFIVIFAHRKWSVFDVRKHFCKSFQTLRTFLLFSDSWLFMKQLFHAAFMKHNSTTVHYDSSCTINLLATVLFILLSQMCEKVLEDRQPASTPCPCKAGSHYNCSVSLFRNILDLAWAWWKVSRLVEPFTSALSIRQTQQRRHKDPQQRERASMASDWHWLCLMYYPWINRNKSAEVDGGGLLIGSEREERLTHLQFKHLNRPLTESKPITTLWRDANEEERQIY